MPGDSADQRRPDRAVDGPVKRAALPTPDADRLSAGARLDVTSVVGRARAILASVTSQLAAMPRDVYRTLPLVSRASVAAEYVRLARDLHDGVMQSLTSVALQIAAADRAIPTSPAHAHVILERVADDLLEGQAKLRTLIAQLRRGNRQPDVIVNVATALAQVADRVKQVWGVDVLLTVAPGVQQISSRTQREIYLIVHEGILNAAQHAGARTIRADIGVTRGRASIRVEDDGIGFDVHGVFDLSELDLLGIGPAVLKERVRALNGTLTLNSTAAGAHLDITVPIDAS